jgi:putative membrane protein
MSTRRREQLLKQAKSMKVAVVEGLEKDNREAMTRLIKLRGSNYDREYVDFMVRCHEKTSSLYENWAKKTKDSDLRDIATKAARMEKDHLKQARDLKDRLKKR